MNQKKRITASVNHLIRQLVPPPRRLIPGKGSYVPTGKTGMEASPEYSVIVGRMLDKRICRGTALKHRHAEGLNIDYITGHLKTGFSGEHDLLHKKLQIESRGEKK
ncbi:MAG: hypothetical protein EOM73_15585 [Bacteroidia bacterium]|nr:hypothetical protein [Bacteroidia bacterium]